MAAPYSDPAFYAYGSVPSRFDDKSKAAPSLSRPSATDVRLDNMEANLSRLLCCTVEGIAQSALYFAPQDMPAAHAQTAAQLISECEAGSRALLFDHDMTPHRTARLQRVLYAIKAAEQMAGMVGRALRHFAILHGMIWRPSARLLLQKVADPAMRLLLTTAGAVEQGNTTAARAMAQEAVHAIDSIETTHLRMHEMLLGLTPMLFPEEARLIRAALFFLISAADAAAHIALLFRVTPERAVAAINALEAHQSGLAPVAPAGRGDDLLAPLPPPKAPPRLSGFIRK